MSVAVLGAFYFALNDLTAGKSVNLPSCFQVFERGKDTFYHYTSEGLLFLLLTMQRSDCGGTFYTPGNLSRRSMVQQEASKDS